MTNRITLKQNLGKTRLMVAGMLAVSAPFIVGLVQAQSEAPLAFEVASVRQHALPGPMRIVRPWTPTIQCPPPYQCGISGSRFNEEVASLTDLIMDAYSVKRFQISGLPSWGDSGRDVYDITAKVNGDQTPTLDQVRRMLQTLLADRFQLRLHHETRELSIYALVVAKNGPKLTPLTANWNACRIAGFTGGDGGRGQGGFADDPTRGFMFAIERLPEMLSTFAGRPVIDKTGLEGRYCTLDGQEPLLAVMVQLNPALGRGEVPQGRVASPDADSAGTSIFTAVEEKLGLKLESQKGPVDVLVIDRVTRPSEN